MNALAKSLILTVGLVFGFNASAADQLNNTKWTTYNDNGQPDAVLRFSESNGKLSAKIVEILDPRAKGQKVCGECKGKFKNKPFIGATVLWDLESDSKDANKYINGSGIEPETGRTFSGKAELTGDTLKLRGYKGISLLGKTRILKRR